MNVAYGLTGRPVGSIDEFAFYGVDGTQFGENRDGYLYFTIDNGSAKPGQYAGSFSNGVIFNAYGEAQAFTDDAQRALPLVPPKLTSALTNRVAAKGFDVSHESPRSVPDFLSDAFARQTANVTGIFL